MPALVAVPETVRHPDRVFRLRLHAGIPARMRLVMAGAMLGIFAAFTLARALQQPGAQFPARHPGRAHLAVIGAVPFVLFAVAAISQALSARLPTRRSVSLGLPMLLARLAALEGSLFTRAL